MKKRGQFTRDGVARLGLLQDDTDMRTQFYMTGTLDTTAEFVNLEDEEDEIDPRVMVVDDHISD